MAKEVVAQIKLQIPAGQANPAPPVGTALGPRGINIMAFCKEFNAATQKQAGDILPVVITVFKDKSFTFITKSPPAAILLKKAANITAGIFECRGNRASSRTENNRGRAQAQSSRTKFCFLRKHSFSGKLASSERLRTSHFSPQEILEPQNRAELRRK